MLMKKGKDWALSCVAVSAAVLVGMSTTVQADTTYNANSENTTSTKTGNTATTQATNSDSAVTQAANDEVQDGKSVSDDFDNENQNTLGYASNFHIFANEAHLNAHTNGNVAVGQFYGNVNFGTNVIDGRLAREVSYIQTPHNIANSSFVTSGDTRNNKVVFGENNTIDVTNTSRPNINNVDLDHINSGEIYQDKNGNQYINFKDYFDNFLSEKSASLTNKPPQVSVTNSDFPDQNQRVINLQDYQVTDDNKIVIDLDPSVLTSGTPLTIYGLSKDVGGTNIVINVDTKGQDPYNVNSQIKLIYNDGTTNNDVERPNQETEFFDDNHLLWNFYDSTANDKLYAGEINIDRPFQGSVLAPKATVTANANLDGNIIANEVNVNAESHRWDYQDDSVIETEYERPIIIPGELPELPGEEDNNGGNIKEPDEEEEEEDIDPDTGGLVDGGDKDDNDGNTTNPEEPDTDKEENTDEDKDNGGDSIINGGSEGTDSNKDGDLDNGLLPNVVGNNNDESQTPNAKPADESGLLPQTSETTGILATIIGLIMLAFGLVLKATHIKKED